MRYLLDTGVWYRGNIEPEWLPRSITDLLIEEGQDFGLSAISVWEIGKKFQRGKLRIDGDLSHWLQAATASPIVLLPLTPEIIADAMALPNFPNRDPADELIVATARVHDLTLLTTDTALKNYRRARIRYFKPVLGD